MWTLAQYTKKRHKLCNLKNEIGHEYFRNKPNTLKFKELMAYKHKCDLKKIM